MLLYIIRHADPDYAAGTITPAGHKEAEALAETMPKLAPTHLYSSPLGRAKDTAAYSADKTGLPVKIEEWTQEIGGFSIERPPPYGTMVIWDDHGEITRSTFYPGPLPENWVETPPFDMPGFAEKLRDIADSSDAFLTRHGFKRDGAIYRLDEAVEHVREQRIAVFCHGGFGLTWLSHLLQIPSPLLYSGFFLWPSSVTTLLFDERTAGVATPRCVGLADVSHLHLAGIAPQPSGIKANAT